MIRKTLILTWKNFNFFLSIVRITESLQDKHSKHSRDVRLHILHGTMNQRKQKLNSASHWVFAVDVSKKFWCYLVLLALCWCCTSEGKALSFLKHNFSYSRCWTDKKLQHYTPVQRESHINWSAHKKHLKNQWNCASSFPSKGRRRIPRQNEKKLNQSWIDISHLSLYANKALFAAN